MKRTSAEGSSPGAGTGRSGRRNLVADPGTMGTQLIAPTASTPGSCRSVSVASAKKRAWRASRACRNAPGWLDGGGGRAISKVSTPWGTKPGSTRTRRSKLRTSSPAPTRRTAASATSATTRPRARRRRSRLVPAVPPSLSAFQTAGRATCRAGARPNTSALTTETPIANARTLGLREMRATCSSSAGSAALSASRDQEARSSPVAPPARASSRASVVSWRTRRQREAPRLMRTAISRSRASARASRRWATLTQPMRSTSATAPMRTMRAGRTGRTKSAWSGNTLTPQPASRSGNSFSSWAPIPAISAWACSTVTPGRSRAIASIHRPDAVLHSSVTGTAIHTSAPGGTASDSGITPTIVRDRPSSITSRPRIEASPPNRLFQRRVDTTATGGASGRPSSSPIARPRLAFMPSTSKKSAVTTAPLRRTGSFPVVRLTSRGPKPARPEKTRLRSRQWTKFAGLTTLRSRFRLTLRSQTSTSRSGSWKGRGRRSTASTMLNRAALAPMPRARVATATTVKPGRRTRSRTPSFRSCRRSFIPASLSSIFRKGHATAPAAGRFGPSSICAPGGGI